MYRNVHFVPCMQLCFVVGAANSHHSFQDIHQFEYLIRIGVTSEQY